MGEPVQEQDKEEGTKKQSGKVWSDSAEGGKREKEVPKYEGKEGRVGRKRR